MKLNGMKILKVVIPVASVAATFAANWLSDKKQDEVIAQKVAEALAKINKGDA